MTHSLILALTFSVVRASHINLFTHLKQDLSKRSCDPSDASTEKSTTVEISQQSNNKQNVPSIVARLMGVDLLPIDTKPEAPPPEDKNERKGITYQAVQPAEKASGAPKKSKSSKKENRSSKNAYFRYWSSAANLGKPGQSPEHPQEKELQKFKKEFEAWQAARFLECARVVELGNIPEQWLAHLDLTKEKMTRYENSRNALIEKSMGDNSALLKSRSVHGGDLRKKEMFPADHKESHSFSGRSVNTDFERLSLKDSDLNSDKSSVPARIVILKPGPDSFTTNDESWASSCSLEERDHIEDLLDEVKQRLKYEMEGKTFRKGSMVRGGGIETPFREKLACISQIHQHSPKYAKQNQTMDLQRQLTQSESLRSCQSEIQVNELAFLSPKSMSRYTRNFLSERLENFLNVEDHQNIPDISNDVSGVPPFDDARERLEKVGDILNAETRANYWQDVNYAADAQARSRRHEFDDDGSLQERPSPRNLVRSLSAPLSGSSLGRCLPEDRFILTGAYIKRQQEILECLSPDFKSQMTARSDFLEKVCNIKHSSSLRKKLFNRKFQSGDLSQTNESDLKDIMGGPTVLKSFNESNESLTEVPNSPASVCSSAYEEFWKPMDNPSPISNSDVTSVGDQSVNNVFREISSNLTELRRQLNQLEYEGSEITSLTEDRSEPEVVDFEPEVVDIEYEAEAYIKDLLIASGLYDGSISDKSFSRWDPFVKPLSNWVFEKVEEAYRRPTIDTNQEAKSYDDTSLERKLLFDLLNEALSIILGPPRTLSKFRRQVNDITSLHIPQGRKLLEQLLEMIREYVNPSMDMDSYSLDDLVAYDLHIMPWSNLIDEEIRDVGKKWEYEITEELVDELVMDLLDFDSVQILQL
ncbi:hypothetical protein Cgig2_009804 [Carnegiea gigantea]|uniref:DUF4378 domain-containing protein n=1 Tax=Carnegiea gigantea TaxID=171969 RepID=A0A9Q1JQ16_9CARY|nr:hypothetical protein Cgig2_009804 [Carnegiea gigantea]